MSYPYPDREPGSFESYYDAQARTCPSCGVKTKGQQCPCETPVERERIRRDWQPAAVVFPTKNLTLPETLWFDATWPHTRTLAVLHARMLARATRGRCEVL